MQEKDLREKFLKFFEAKGHIVIPSASLLPENDPSTLFNSAGMQPLVPYFTGANHPAEKRLADVQKCIRTQDIEEVGDATHHTFFEMLGNWSLGDYFKKEAIEMSWEFLTSEKYLNLDKNRLAVSVFAGDQDAPYDEEAYDLWKNLGVPEKRIAKLPKENNWWGMERGPCGPDTEIFYWAPSTSSGQVAPEFFDEEDNNWVEIWNNVFMQYDKKAEGLFEALKQKNVDTGMGLERTLAALNNLDDNYKTELFWPIIQKIEEISGKKYEDNQKSFRIIADHVKASVMIMADGVLPLNVGAGYVLRRIIRRAIRHGKILGINDNFTKQIGETVVEIYKDVYPNVKNENILVELEKEENKFRKTLESGLKEFEKLSNITGKEAFNLYQTYGFPLEMTEELAKEKNIAIDKAEFEKEFQIHQEKSRTASAGMFKGGLADDSVETTKLHTAAHLLLAAIRKISGEEIIQKGANITAERLRFDFNYPEKLTPEQIAEIEKLVNQKISEKIPVEMNEMSKTEALKLTKSSFDPSKYGDMVKVYKIGNFSLELCGGPHVSNTSELGHFKIQKEESSSAGVRRIKAILG